ncbi:hypothetical protein [Alicyclobacillus mengziensis]|uniref:Uncharacterized protein n=1 Tax=Alicyclobacillus mengziensis TaxID=2931921 RepID=A0A9X7W022_9BACL|nr:hypothetical protein [Alicyclobacillus mengziensis]QSO48129.1 hypothetical protein JZ786_03715 [Alicyclobacillus mengziensis]
MGKRTDRAFHLTVAALALTLSVVSVGTMVYQRHPEWMNTWLKQSGLPLQQGLNKSPAVNHPNRANVANTANATGTHSATASKSANHTGNTTSAGKSGASSDVAYKPAYKMANNSILIQVEGVASDVSGADVANVNNILSKYGIVNLVSQSLQMNVYQEIHIELAKTPADYQKALSGLGVSTSDAKQFTLDTGGFTQGETIVIPLYQNKTTPDLTNTLCHELTHAFLNANVGNFPSWMNEGLAVTNGMNAQSRAENGVEYQGYARQMAESILDAQKNGTLEPLVSNEAKVLAGTASYDLELQDWLAVRDLIATKGYNAFSDYFYRLNLGESEAQAFQSSFGTSESAFNATFTNLLKVAANTPNDPVALTFSVQSGFHGALRFLQHSNTIWTGFRPQPGQTSTITIAANGSIKPAQNLTAPIQDSNPADATTLYVNIDSNTPLTYHGQKVSNAGFAIDYHYGMYAFVNSWITLSGGKSLYFHSPSLFGVTIDKIQETAPNQWFVQLMQPPTIPGAAKS